MPNDETQPDPKIAAELQELREQSTKLRTERDELYKIAKLRNEAAHPVYDLIDPDFVARMVADRVTLDNDYLVAKNGGSINEILNEVKTKHAYMTRADYEARKAGKATPASASTQAAPSTQPTPNPLEKLFGPKSDSRLANDLGKRDIKEYRRLKALAKEQGILK